MLPISPLKRTDSEADQPEPAPRQRPHRASRAAGIMVAYVTIWPDGPPPWLSVKERDAAILDWLSARGVRALPCSRTIRRILNAE